MMAELIAFFSRRDENYVNGVLKMLDKGNTETAAEILQKLTGADLFQIVPARAYPKDYRECTALAKEEQKRDARPKILNWPASLDRYDTVYLGYPNYWGTMPMTVFTFLEQRDFTGKTIRPFCTHEGSGLGSSLADIKKLCRGAKVEEGLAIRGGAVGQCRDLLEAWLTKGM